MKEKILVINPGSTSTKIALYKSTERIWQENIEHPAGELAKYDTIFAQRSMRTNAVMNALKAHGDSPKVLAAVSARGGLLPPVNAGAYLVNEEMLDVLEHRPVNHHASNLGAAIAYEIAKPLGIPAYIYDPVTVDEMIDVVRITGIPEIVRHGRGHNLNMRAAALRYCRENQMPYKDQNLIVAHLGGGITVSLHSKGRIIDLISDDEGAFSPERSGTLPLYELTEYLHANGFDTPKAATKKLQRSSGLTAHLGTTDAKTVEDRINNGDKKAVLVYEAMALSVARCIGKLAVVVNGQVDGIVLTGGIAYSECFTGMIQKRVAFIAPVSIIPGENEMQALAEGAWRVLKGEEKAAEYKAPAK